VRNGMSRRGRKKSWTRVCISASARPGPRPAINDTRDGTKDHSPNPPASNPHSETRTEGLVARPTCGIRGLQLPCPTAPTGPGRTRTPSVVIARASAAPDIREQGYFEAKKRPLRQSTSWTSAAARPWCGCAAKDRRRRSVRGFPPLDGGGANGPGARGPNQGA